MRRSGHSARWSGLGMVAILALARPAAGAVDFSVDLPVVFAAPGQVVQIPIEMSQSLDTLGVESIQYTMPIDPVYVSNVTLLPEGVVWSWGAPFTNVTSTLVAVAASGVAPTTSTSTRLHTLQFTVSPTAPVGGTMFLYFPVLRFNETTPTFEQNAGALRIRTTPVGVADASDHGARLIAAPNPLRSSTRIRYQLPAEAAGRPMTLEVFALDGRRLRMLRDETSVAGEREAEWDGRDASGRRLAPGVYLMRLACGPTRFVRRLVILG